MLNISLINIYNNCIYSSIAHAISNLKDPYFSYTQSWDENNYLFNFDTERGVISFYISENIAVGAVRNEESKRRNLYPQFNAISFFDNASDFIKNKAENNTLEYLYDEKDNIIKPMATTGFWIENNNVFSNDNIEEFKLHGGEFIIVLASELDKLKEFWTEQYDLNKDELNTIEYIYNIFMNHKKLDIKNISDIINKKYEGYDECIESLNEGELKRLW